MAKKQPIWAHCNKCTGKTKHDVIAERVQSFSGSFGHAFDYHVTKTSQLIECRGCEDVALRVDWWHSEVDWSDEIDYYPPRVSRRPPSWEHSIPMEWQSLLSEIYTALHADSRRLAMMGARALVDMYMNDAVGDIGGFDRKLAQLVTAGLLGDQDKKILIAALEAGHAAAHRGYLPEADQVSHVMDIVENLLQKHTLTSSAEALNRHTPSRQLLQTKT